MSTISKRRAKIEGDLHLGKRKSRLGRGLRGRSGFKACHSDEKRLCGRSGGTRDGDVLCSRLACRSSKRESESTG